MPGQETLVPILACTFLFNVESVFQPVSFCNFGSEPHQFLSIQPKEHSIYVQDVLYKLLFNFGRQKRRPTKKYLSFVGPLLSVMHVAQEGCFGYSVGLDTAPIQSAKSASVNFPSLKLEEKKIIEVFL